PARCLLTRATNHPLPQGERGSASVDPLSQQSPQGEGTRASDDEHDCAKEDQVASSKGGYRVLLRACLRGKPMIRLVLFDFDGTLVDSNARKRACMRDVVADLPGGLAALEQARKLGGNRYKLFAEIARLLDPAGEPSTIARRGGALAAAYTRCCARAISAAPERRGARAALAALKARGIKTWVNSATPHADLLAIVRDRGLMRFLDGVLGGPASKAAN